MLVSLNWLKNYVNFGYLTAEQLGEKITKSGIEVDGIEYIVSETSEHIVVGYVEECEQHPNADKLKLCQVNVGEEENLQIICGAPNVAKGQKVVVAKPGAVLPGDFKIKKVKLRGIESNGMICSLQELSVEEKFVPAQYAEGIVVLPDDAVIGEDVDALLNLDDVILEFDLTPNRADALNMLGVAYEVGAILDTEIHLPEPTYATSDEHISEYIEVKVDDIDACPYYGAFIIKDVEVKPTPLWMQNYLLASGIRSINNVVDITNYVLLEYGQPLHAFDYDLLQSKEIVVRRAEDGEKMVTLDDETRTLSPNDLLITNGKEPVALAGVMGGAETEVHNVTKTILLEAAYFNGQNVRQTVKETGLRSEASTRYERGIDPNRVREAGERACELLVKYANGTIVDGIAEMDELYLDERKVDINTQEVNRRLGTKISNEEIEDILRKLRFSYEANGSDIRIYVPTRRRDIAIFEDVLEEIARIYGYDHLPYTLPTNASKPGGLSSEQLLRRQVNGYLQSVGLSEAITYSLVNKRDATMLVSPELSNELRPVSLAMPMSEDHQYLRLSILPELLNRLSYNVARKQANIALYELGYVFLSEETEVTKQPKEQNRLAGAITGTWVNHPWQQEVKQVDFYVLKGILEGLFNYLNIEVSYKQTQLESMHPGRCATVYHQEELIGFIGQVHPKVANGRDLKETYVFDINMEYILQIDRAPLAYKTVPKYPSILRDVAFVLPKDIHAGDVQTEMKRVAASLVTHIEAFDVYTGDNLQPEEKSIAFNIHYQDPNKTLTDEEVDASMNDIMAIVQEKFGGYVRS